MLTDTGDPSAPRAGLGGTSRSRSVFGTSLDIGVGGVDAMAGTPRLLRPRQPWRVGGIVDRGVGEEVCVCVCEEVCGGEGGGGLHCPAG